MAMAGSHSVLSSGEHDRCAWVCARTTTNKESHMAQALPSLQGLRAADVMTRDPVTMESTGTVQDAADLMWAADVRHIPVLERGTLVGMISERDLRSYMLPRPERMFRADEERARLAVSVRAVIPSDVLTVGPDTPMAELLDLLLQEKIGAVPVLAPDTGDLIGMVSYLDVLRAVRPFVHSA
jgi:acetoin utilization protein AcuB